MRLPWPAARMMTLSGVDTSPTASGGGSDDTALRHPPRRPPGDPGLPSAKGTTPDVSSPPMATIAVFNQKGGVGKTTTALNLLAGIAQRGQRPVGIDLDPQAHLSHVFGVQPRLADDTVYSFFVRQRPLARRCRDHEERRGLVPRASRAVEARRGPRQGRQRRDAPAHGAARPGKDRARPVVIDCGPLLNVLSLNAVFACDLLLVPVSADFLVAAGRAGRGSRTQRAGTGVQATAAAGATC